MVMESSSAWWESTDLLAVNISTDLRIINHFFQMAWVEILRNTESYSVPRGGGGTPL